GTDSAIGKRTTAIELVEALNKMGIRTEFVATGQTGLLQGAKYGVPLDAIHGDYMVGELENAIYQAYINEKPKVIIIEGQGSLTHPVYVCGTRAIVQASKPNAVILVHAPGRKYRNYDVSLKLPLPNLRNEMASMEVYSRSPVIALAINHEGLDPDKIDEVCRQHETLYGVPAVDVLEEGPERLAKAIVDRFPYLTL
ncbi:MAG: NAD-dependent epimerase/dehydratase family protein, partial [Methanomassiliicoccales archaeon]|nr:NAD-dependent epimerase/dehydratase family protein [Methanomassiliicoccales archaeon]